MRRFLMASVLAMLPAVTWAQSAWAQSEQQETV